MNPFDQFPSQTFPFLPPKPNPNPNPNLKPHPNFSNSATPIPSPCPSPGRNPASAAELSSTLTNFINLSHHIIASFSNLLPSANQIIQCPFDPNHRMPPHSLFLHHLRCTSSPRPIPNITDLLASLTYTKNLISTDELRNHKRSLGPLSDSNAAEHCFSLDDYLDFTCDFFYRDCPGVVSVSRANGFRRTFTLPSVLSAECVDINGGVNVVGNEYCLKFDGRILPSELWVIKRQVEAWSDFPSDYSSSILTAIIGMSTVKETDFFTLVIANSPRYGVVIDVPMTNHIMLLLSLCLKAILREAMSFVDMLRNPQNLGIYNFKCPALVEALIWLSSKLSVLYGEPTGKFFTLDVLKQCTLHGASNLLFFPLEINAADSFSVKEVPPIESGNAKVKSHNVKANDSLDEGRRNCEVKNVLCKTVTATEIFVSQIAAAVSALCERSLLEHKIRGIWSFQPPINRFAEHNDISLKAEEERGKRPNYRPIIEHDGLPRLQTVNQEMNKGKTKEELLAEERDYKRRRMSYRGKKLKRTPSQVTRDIIEEYMEEITEAGGIGCFIKELQEGVSFDLKASFDHDRTIKAGKSRKNDYDFSTETEYSHSYWKQDVCSNSNDSIRTSSHATPKDNKESSDLHKNRGSIENHRSSHHEKRRRWTSRSPERCRSHKSYEGNKHHRRKDNLNERDDCDEATEAILPDRRWRRLDENHGSHSSLQNSFEDRYNPSESH